MRLRTFSHDIVVALTICLVLAASSGCSHSMLSGVFVNHDNRSEVDMIRLVESPPGHLSGSLVISALNANGSRKKDVFYDVTGTISASNVSLQLEGGLTSLAEFFGAATNLVGNLKGKTLTISAGNQTEAFREISQKEYGDTLANLATVGQQIAMIKSAINGIQETESSGKQLNVDLKSYIGWGQQRIDHVRIVREWYVNRIEFYTKCLRTIRPLASSGVPSWRWQGCVLTVENDKYSRDQETQAVGGAQRQNRTAIASLDARINAAQQQFPRALERMNSACRYAKDVDACMRDVKNLRSRVPDGFLDGSLVAAYRNVIPQISNALNTDSQVSSEGENSLSVTAQQVTRLYQSAR